MRKLFWISLGAVAVYGYMCYKNNEARREEEELEALKTKQEVAAEQVREAAHAVKEAVVDGVEQVKKAAKK